MNWVCYKHLLKAFSILKKKRTRLSPFFLIFPIWSITVDQYLAEWLYFCSIRGNNAAKVAANARDIRQPEVLLFFWKWLNVCIFTEHPFIHSFSHLTPPPPTETLNSSILSFTSCLTVLPVVLTHFTLWLICSLLHQWIGRSAD